MVRIDGTLEEIYELVNGRGARASSSPSTSQTPTRRGSSSRRALKGMKSAMQKANARARLKNGAFRKGWDQRRLMKYAHRLRRKSA